MEPIKYIAENQLDERWGLTVCSVGYQRVGAGDSYPPSNHDKEYVFSPKNGRVLREYQLVYIVDGEGTLTTRNGGTYRIVSGDMFLLYPDEWHTYQPDSATGWSEYWIGFRGANIDHRVAEGFFSVKTPLYHVGVNQRITSLYREAIEIAKSQQPYFQQFLAGIVNHILGLMFMTERQNHLRAEGSASQIVERGRVAMQSAVESDVTVPEIARQLNVSYSTFRHMFKLYTGQSPLQYLINLRIYRARQLLCSTTLSVKEIAYMLRFDSPEYFATLFRRRVGVSPSAFRRSATYE